MSEYLIMTFVGRFMNVNSCAWDNPMDDPGTFEWPILDLCWTSVGCWWSNGLSSNVQWASKYPILMYDVLSLDVHFLSDDPTDIHSTLSGLL